MTDKQECPMCDAGLPLSTKIRATITEGERRGQTVILSDSVSDKIRNLLNGTERPRGRPVSFAYLDDFAFVPGSYPRIDMLEHQIRAMRELDKVSSRVMVFDSLSQTARSQDMSEQFRKAYAAGMGSKPTLSLANMLLPYLHPSSKPYTPVESQLALAVRSTLPKFTAAKYVVQITRSR